MWHAYLLNYCASTHSAGMIVIWMVVTPVIWHILRLAHLSRLQDHVVSGACTGLHSAAEHKAAQHSVAVHKAAQHRGATGGAAQHSTAQHSTA